MKTVGYFSLFLICYGFLLFMWGKGCSSKEKEIVIVTKEDSSFEILKEKYSYEVTRLESEIIDLRALKQKTLTRYQVIRESAVKDTVSACMDILAICDTLMAQSDSIIMNQDKIIAKDKFMLAESGKKIQGLKNEVIKTEVILKGVQKNYNKEVKRKRFWRGFALVTIGTLLLIK